MSYDDEYSMLLISDRSGKGRVEAGGSGRGLRTNNHKSLKATIICMLQ